MRTVHIVSSLFFLAACPLGPELDTDVSSETTGIESTGIESTSSPTTGSGDASTGTSTGDSTTGSTGDASSSTTGDPGCHVPLAEAPAGTCAMFPWGNPECSSRQDPLPTCEEVFDMLAAIPECDGAVLCDYQQCAEALLVAPCGARPTECEPLFACVSAGEPEQPTCSPGFCDDFEMVALQDGLDPEFAEELGKVCAWNPCFACNEVATACAEAPCPAIEAKCEAEMATCDCG